ncbi:MAG: serine/threonine-protein kinase, partial [Fibrobacter sp.]|nr:serine/threonine-protein kinase [Fibrobacter sp.]
MEEYLSETVSISVNDHNVAKPAEPAVPEEIGSGVVRSVLGKGGAAVVYEIWNKKLEISRAVKLWRPFLSEKVLNRFETEIKITAKLHHPNIVEIHNVGEWQGLPFIEMEKIEGLSLKELLKKRGAFPPEVSLAVAISICRALTYAHNHVYNLSERRFRGVTHCDIKPANIMVGIDGIVKLMDFGIAHPANVPKESDQNKITGSLQYMSPEQLGSRKIDPRTDIFSLGVVFYEMVSGSKAFPAQSFDDLIVKRNKNDFVPLESFCKDVSPKIRTIISKCMEVDADSRYATSNMLLQDLERAYRKLTSIPPEQIISRFMNGKNLRKKSNFISTPVAVIIALGLLTLSAT